MSHLELDHTSVLKMIEWRWNLEPLTVRDGTANNLADVLDFSANPDLRAKQFDVPQRPFGTVCLSGLRELEEWHLCTKSRPTLDGRCRNS